MYDSDNNNFRQAPVYKREVDTLNHISFGGTWRKPEHVDVVVSTIGHLLSFHILVLSTAKFPERY